MWLIHASDLRFEQFFGDLTPPYAILSHRWGNNEISLQDLRAAIKDGVGVYNNGFTTANFWKIQKTREEARRADIEWVWIDTCCINKESSAELSEAINSMYKWYQNAKICYVYMPDVIWTFENGVGRPGQESSYPGGYEHSASAPGLETMATMQATIASVSNMESFKKSSWFSRGWTLQELLAPRTIKFFDRGWNFIGMKTDLVNHISERTGIDAGFLEEQISFEQASVAEKMSWVSGRQTTREEDMAYCLLGIFGVNMPLLYGEGKKAFMRLQLEIIRMSDDESIFAWTREPGNWRPREQIQLLEHKRQEAKLKRETRGGYEAKPFRLHSGLLAEEPEEFAKSGHIRWDRARRFVKRLPYTMTNQGLQFYVEVYPSQLQYLEPGSTFDIKLNCFQTQAVQTNDGSRREVDKPIVLTLKKEGAGNDHAWRRWDCLTFQGPAWSGSAPMEEKTQVAFYIRQDGL